jgi:hypothetical protein
MAVLSLAPLAWGGDERRPTPGSAQEAPEDDALQQEPTVTAPTGPLPGRRFGEHANPRTIFIERDAVRRIQKEMSENAGRDAWLQEHGWGDFQGVVRRLETYLGSDRPGAGLLASAATEELNHRSQEALGRLAELKSLRAKVVQKLREPYYQEYTEVLQRRLERQQDQLGVLRALASLIGVAVRGASVPGGVMAFYGLIQKTREGAGLHYENLIIRDRSDGFIDLHEMANDLQVLIEQYEMRLRMQHRAVGNALRRAAPGRD